MILYWLKKKKKKKECHMPAAPEGARIGRQIPSAGQVDPEVCRGPGSQEGNVYCLSLLVGLRRVAAE